MTQSALEIGESSDTSSATVIRFVRQMGFSSLEDAKVNIARNISPSSEDEPLDPVIADGDSLKSIAEKLTHIIDDTIELTRYELDFSQLHDAVTALKAAKTIYLLGIGSSGVVARDLYSKLTRANFRAVYHTDTHSALANSVHLTDRDVVLAISYSGKTREILVTVRQAQKQGARVIAITRNENSPLCRTADILLSLPRNESLLRIGTIASKYSTMWVTDLLFLGLINEGYEEIEAGILRSAHAVLTLKE